MTSIDSAFVLERLKEVVAPGGSGVQCDLITSYLHMKATKSKVPLKVFVEVEDIAASGSYWIS